MPRKVHLNPDVYRSRLAPEQVVALRAEFLAVHETTSQTKFAKAKGVSRTMMADLLSGRTFRDLPGALSREVMTKDYRQFTAEQVIAFRRAYAPPLVTAASLARTHCVDKANMTRILNGTMYAHVPGAIAKLRHGGARPRLSDRDVIEARRAHSEDGATAAILAPRYGIGREAMKKILDGFTYKHLLGQEPEEFRLAA